MFSENKYTRWYYQIVNHCKMVHPDGYSERHHIIPRSLGGSNDPDNIVVCSARHHFILHALLVRMTSGEARGKMWWALHCMTMNGHGQARYVNSRLVHHARANAPTRVGWSPSLSWIANRTSENHWFYGVKRPDHSNAMRGSGNPRYGKVMPDHNKIAVIASNRRRRGLPKSPHQIITCDVCGKSGGSANMKRYHFINCKDYQHV